MSVTSSEIVVKIEELNTGLGPLSLEIFFLNGLANPDVGSTTTITLDPVIVDVSRLGGTHTLELSIAGSVIYAKVAGVGVADSDYIMLIDKDSSTGIDTDLC